MARLPKKYYYRENHPDLFLKVRQIINDIDPKGLIDFCGPEEYDMEVEDVLTKLNDCNSSDETYKMVVAVFTHWFGDPGDLDMYINVGRKVFELKKITPTNVQK